MRAPYYLVLDAGTTAIKALLFDADLTLVNRAVHDMKKTRPQSDRVEQDPEEIISASIDTIKEVVAKSGIRASEIHSMGITNQRETIVAWSAHTGKAIYPAIVWEDTRTTWTCAIMKVFGKEQFVRERTGLKLDPYFSATKIKWILKNVPEAQKLLAQETLRVGTIDTWLLWRLSTEHSFKTDFTNASRTLLFDINSRQWDTDLLKLFGVPEGLLPSVEPSQASYGSLNSAILGLPVPIRAVCGDQQASMNAAGISPNTTKITYGTGAFLMQVLGSKPSLHHPFFTTMVPGPHGTAAYALEAKVGECGSRITPLLGNQPELEKVYRQIALEVNEYIKLLPHKPEKLIADGGAIRNPALAKIQAEVSGIPVIEQKVFDGTGMGVAKLLQAS